MTQLTRAATRGIVHDALNTLAVIASSDPDEFRAAVRLTAELGKKDGGVFEFVGAVLAEAILAKVDTAKGD